MGGSFGKCFDPNGARYGLPTYPSGASPPTGSPRAASYGPGACVREVSR